ncbi:MAG: hypothetical protein DRR16_11270 [Candidatus Parabeggiatoa sp. nov. 3]|nr:MAG: hypothetical protein DRQ99_15400 [Gammaproteobacteria bacterium]RKZ85779.1 MAG: hypothetical protein DRR16_11270 [Gammaproteobacteria bacterium]
MSEPEFSEWIVSQGLYAQYINKTATQPNMKKTGDNVPNNTNPPAPAMYRTKKYKCSPPSVIQNAL